MHFSVMSWSSRAGIFADLSVQERLFKKHPCQTELQFGVYIVQCPATLNHLPRARREPLSDASLTLKIGEWRSLDVTSLLSEFLVQLGKNREAR